MLVFISVFLHLPLIKDVKRNDVSPLAIFCKLSGRNSLLGLGLFALKGAMKMYCDVSVRMALPLTDNFNWIVGSSISNVEIRRL